ncbi:C39 family peptidase [Spiroplasma melliferum]|uniref:C39 family peptidase n=1 Tax=Spiroplasma melliferum TaxID=2134 RepID=UPI0002A6247E|nr:C39 family peptidase [Spiroplasma melliferum]ELL44838.1 hypothetical protein SMIPMB4A_v3c2090 [Spiroplasma melliferum IPMB4A]
MKKSTKKWWVLNINLIFLVVLLLSFILYILHCAYGNSKLTIDSVKHPVLLSSMINEDDLGTINTNGIHIPTQSDIKNKLKTKYHNLNINDINISNITQWNAKITARDESSYIGEMGIKYTLDKTTTDDSISLQLNLFYQETNYWCGPATLQMIVHYFTGKKISQQELSYQMNTETYHGTIPEDMLKSLNALATPNKRRYINKRLHQNFGVTNDEQKMFYYDIKNSLSHNFPVALAIYGRYPWTGNMRHYVVIYGIELAATFENYQYLILDPTLGKVQVKQSEISNLFSLENNGRISIYN